MALTIEDGTGVAGADSYLSVANADSYHAAMGNAAWAEEEEAVKEQALRQAALYIDRVWGSRFSGVPSTSTQGLEWPRLGSCDRNGFSMDHKVPAKVATAASELALRALSNDLQPDLDWGGVIKKQTSMIGPIREETEYGSIAKADAVYARISDTLAPLLRRSGTVSELVRA